MTISVQAGDTSSPLPPPYVGPGDVTVLGAARTFWGYRAYTNASAGVVNIANIQRTSPSLNQLFKATTTGLLDVAAVAAFVAGSPANFSGTFEDQTGGGRVLNSAPVGYSNPIFILSDGTSKPCARFDGTNRAKQASAFDTVANPVSFAGVYVSNNPSASFNTIVGANQAGSGPLNVRMAGSGSIDNLVAATNIAVVNPNSLHGVLHDFVAVFNGASGHLYVDGIDVAGNTGTGTLAGTIYTIGTDGPTPRNWIGDFKEWGVWARAISGAEALAYHNNASAFWGY